MPEIQFIEHNRSTLFLYGSYLSLYVEDIWFEVSSPLNGDDVKHESVDQMYTYISRQLTNECHDDVPMTPVVSSVLYKRNKIHFITKIGTHFHYNTGPSWAIVKYVKCDVIEWEWIEWVVWVVAFSRLYISHSICEDRWILFILKQICYSLWICFMSCQH